MRNLGEKLLSLAIGSAVAVGVTAQPTDLSGINCKTDAAGAPVSCEFESAEIRLAVEGSYRTGFFNASGSESIAYDPRTRRVFIANNLTQAVDVVNITAPSTPQLEFSIDVSALIEADNDVCEDENAEEGDEDAAANGNENAIGIGIPESVAISEDERLLAVVVAPGGDVTRKGVVAFYNTDVNMKNEKIEPLETEEPLCVGFTPNMAVFTPDGKRLLVANEGEPQDSYKEDPEGLVSVIDLNDGVETASVNNIGFEQLNGSKEELIQKGVRITGFKTPDDTDDDEDSVDLLEKYNPCEPDTLAAVNKDLEPEHIAISADSRTAWVTLAENNALAVIDISQGIVSKVLPFGFKDHNLASNGLDATDNGVQDREVDIARWPIKGMYMPSQVASYAVNGETYLVFGNEGTRRNYDVFEEVFGNRVDSDGSGRTADIDADEYRITKADINRDDFPPEVFKEKDFEAFEKLRLKVSWPDSDTDCENVGLGTDPDDPENELVKYFLGDLNEIFSFGTRSFSIRSVGGGLIFESGDDFEQITALATDEPCAISDDEGNSVVDDRGCFNTPDDENSFDETSDLRGPEPISVATGKIDDDVYAFIGLERIGGVMVYEITDPDKPEFQQYINNRNFLIDPDALNPNVPPNPDGSRVKVCVEADTPQDEESPECAAVGDLSPEDLVFVPQNQSPIQVPLLLVGNETSGSVTVFRIEEKDDDEDDEDDDEDDDEHDEDDS